MMKKLLLILIFGALFLSARAQGGGTQNNSWSLMGNVGTSDRNFLGTTDKNPLIIKTNDMERMRLLPDCPFLGIGTPTPLAPLHLHNQTEQIPGGKDLPPGPPQPYIPFVRNLIKFTNPETGISAENGFDIFFGDNSVYFQQNEQANFFLRGPEGGIIIYPNGNISIQKKISVNGNTYINDSVGIGVSNPSQKLHVVGNSYFDGNSYISGNLGIGVNNPAQKLHVVGNTYIQNGKLGVGISSPAQPLHVVGKTFLDGNVGIGISTPAQPLHVVGNTYIQDGNVSIGINSSSHKLRVEGDSYLNGNVGIGMSTPPQTKLAIAGALQAQSANIYGRIYTEKLSIEHTESGNYKYAAYIKTNNDLTKAIGIVDANNHDVFIVYGNGVLSTKKIFTEKIEVSLGCVGNSWYDHVFYPDYNLRSLSDLEKFITENCHLPEIPSAEEVKEKGIDLGDMQSKLLLKIEELTLYIIDLQKQIDELKKQ